MTRDRERRTHDRRGPGHRRPITVALVDEEALIRTALARALAKAGLEVVGEAADGPEAIEMVTEVRPDVVLMSLELAGISSIEAITRLGLLAPSSRILVLTRSEHNRVVEAIVAGATGYMLKSAGTQAIVDAVGATSAGESVLSSEIAGKLLARIRERDIPATASSVIAAAGIRAVLTERELDVFERLA